VIKRYLSDVRRSTSGSEKDESRKSLIERHELREGLRRRIMILALLHFSEPFGDRKNTKDCPAAVVALWRVL
jgi:hypothetical protein